MESKRLMESKSFVGTLSKNGDRVQVSFAVQIEISGEAQITLDRFPLDDSTKFIAKYFYSAGTEFERFALKGASLDGTEFDCDNIIFTSLKDNLFEAVRTICPVIHYSLATLTMPHEHSGPPVLIWRLKGFECFAPLSASTDLGTIYMVGAKDADGKDEVSGFIRVSAGDAPQDLVAWRKSAENFCDHLRHVMSFAANADLSFPITEFMNEEMIEIELYSRTKQQKSVWPPFYWLNLQEIFQCAIENFFKPKFPVENLYFAVKWFNMHSSYREANLITAMTVLENLIDSNLSEQDGLLVGNKTFEKLRKKLSAVVKDEVKSWTGSEEAQQAFIYELNNKFSDLKRRSLIEKLNLLAMRWGVRLGDIEKKMIKEAKSARDQVVHRGHYKPSPKVVGDLHDHVLTVRELVVRFILTALQFEGRYRSYVGGQHDREFGKDAPNLEYSPVVTP